VAVHETLMPVRRLPEGKVASRDSRTSEASMKFLTLTLSAAALVALAASPAPAASRHHVRHYYGGSYASGYYGRPLNSGGVNSPGPIYRQGHYLGTDPDPRIREEIVRDPYFERR
jgi:hypothetical protein